MDEFGLGPIFGSVDKVINLSSAVADTAPPSKERMILEAVLARLRSIRAEAPVTLQTHLANLKHHAESVRDGAAKLGPEFDATQARLNQVKAETDQKAQEILGKLKVPPLPTPPVPLPPIDLELGSRLRNEVLDRYLPQSEATRPFDPGKDIWEDWK